MIMDNELDVALSWIEKQFKKKGEFEISYEEKEYLVSKANEIVECGHILLIFKNKKEEISVDTQQRDFIVYITDFYAIKK